MSTKLSEKGQIVIPIELRKKYHIQPGAEIELMDIGGEIVVLPITVKSPIDEAKGYLKGGRTAKEMMRTIRKEEMKVERKKLKLIKK